MYEYQAEVVRIIDGDTVKLNVDLGFHIRHQSNFRLDGINAPEIRGKERPLGLLAKEALIAMIPVGSTVMVRTKRRPGKYGRWIGTIFSDTSVNVADQLVKLGHAVYRVY